MSDPITPNLLPRESPELVRKVELLISTLLRTGVIASLAIVLVGLVLSFIHHPGYLSNPSYWKQITSPGHAIPHSLLDVIRGVTHLRGEAIIMSGLLLLIATPVLRVAVSIIAFLVERDWVFVVATTFVLAMLVLSFVLGRIEG